MKTQAIYPGLAGLVMAGGQSKRMGTDKALLHFSNGPTLLDIACAKISSLAPVWHVSCAFGNARPGYPSLEDSLENFGPLAGILKGLENAREHGCLTLLVLACDLPLMPASLLAALYETHISARADHLLTVYQNSASGVLEMQAAVYDIRALPFFQDAAKKNQRRLTAVIPAESRLIVPYSADLEPYFLNCNNPVDLEKASEYIGKITPPE